MTILFNALALVCLALQTSCGKGTTFSKANTQANEQVSVANTKAQDGQDVPQDNLSGEEHARRGYQLMQTAKPKEALEEYKLAIQKGYDTADLRINMSLVLRRLDRYEEAAEQYRIIIARDDKNWAAHWMLAQLLILELKQYDEGLKEVHRSRELDDLDDIGYVYDLFIAKALDGMGRKREALTHYKIYAKGKAKHSSGALELKEVRQRISEIEKELVKESNQQ